MDNYGTVTTEQLDELRTKIKDLQREKPQSIRSMSTECMISHGSLSSFLKGKEVNWLTYCKILAMYERRKKGEMYPQYNQRNKGK